MSAEFNSDFLDKYSRIRSSHLESYLAKHGHLFKWKPRENVLDIGCGTGDLSSKYIYPFLPKDISAFVCADIKENLVQLTKTRFQGNPKVSCEQMDILAPIQEDQKSKYDHIFSIFLLMWIADQKKALGNIFELLNTDGGCFLVLVHQYVFIDIIYQLLEKPKWKKFVPNVDEMYPFPYRKDKDPVDTITKLMKDIGYKNIKVYLEESTFAFTSEEEYLGFFQAIPNPMSLMTSAEQKEYLQEAVDLAYSYNMIRESGKINDVIGTILVIYAEK